MTDFGPFHTQTRPFFSSAILPHAALSQVRSRRLLAFGFDFLLVSLLALALWTVLFVATLGLSAFFVPPLWPLVAFFYNGLGVSGRHMATPGMRLLDLQMRTADGAPPSFLAAGLHGVLLYFSWMFPPVFLLSLVTPDKRCLHDMLAGLIVVRRPD